MSIAWLEPNQDDSMGIWKSVIHRRLESIVKAAEMSAVKCPTDLIFFFPLLHEGRFREEILLLLTAWTMGLEWQILVMNTITLPRVSMATAAIRGTYRPQVVSEEKGIPSRRKGIKP